jgi:hypothetical protein
MPSSLSIASTTFDTEAMVDAIFTRIHEAIEYDVANQRLDFGTAMTVAVRDLLGVLAFKAI